MTLLHSLDQWLRKFLIKLILVYQNTTSPDHGAVRRSTCRFTPTCSEYTKQAIAGYGIFGIVMGAWHIIRCNPIMTTVGTHEEVPEKISFGKLFVWKKGRLGSADL